MKLYVFLVLSALIFSSSAKSNTDSKTDQNVVVSLYYETLCPYCKAWINDELIPTYEKLQQYMTVEFVPYGNAHQFPNGDSWRFTCQHGPSECKGNIQQSCLLKYVPHQDEFIYAIHCIEESGSVTSEANIEKCLRSHTDASGETINTIMDCADSEEGIQLHHEYGVETESLVPQQTYVPWVTFNHVNIFYQNIFVNLNLYTFMKQKILMPISIEIYRN